MKRRLVNFWTDESGATATEYGLITAGIALAIVAAMNEFGSKLDTKLTSITSSVKKSSAHSQGEQETWLGPTSHSVWPADVVADEPANEVRAPKLRGVKPDQLPK